MLPGAWTRCIQRKFKVVKKGEDIVLSSILMHCREIKEFCSVFHQNTIIHLIKSKLIDTQDWLF